MSHKLSHMTERPQTPLRRLAKQFRQEFSAYKLALCHPRTPKPARWLLMGALGYAMMPFDLIPDFLPVIGGLDDALIVPGLIWLALRMIPHDVMHECRAQARL